MRYLTKSKFKEGLECLTKLYYVDKQNNYANQMAEDPFLWELAKGGFQVGELAKFMFVDTAQKVKEITIDSLDYEESLSETNNRLIANEVVIAEAAFVHNHLFIRADIVHKVGNVLNLYEVKAKSYRGSEGILPFVSYAGKRNECIKSDYSSYLYDLAFQKYVISKAFPNLEVKAHLLMADKDLYTSIEGLNQCFQIVENGRKVEVVMPENLCVADLGNQILSAINLDPLVDKIWYDYSVPNKMAEGMSFEAFVELCEEIYVGNRRVQGLLTSKCSGCQYYTKEGKNEGMKDGKFECWKSVTQKSDEQLKKPFTTTLWKGGTDKFLENAQYFLEDVHPDEICSEKVFQAGQGLDQKRRRKLQVESARGEFEGYYFDKEGYEKEKSQWQWPLHMIDFETSMVAVPFHQHAHPYQNIAFQFSHHVLHSDGRVEHKNQFIHFEKGVYPNLEFIRALRSALEPEIGTIFRYHNHENTYLGYIAEQLEEGYLEVSNQEKAALLRFIHSIRTGGERQMVDLFQVVQKYYFSPYQKGKIGLKFTLPAIIKDSPLLIEKYSSLGKYGKELEMKSLNFHDQQWIQEAKGNDPYKTLPPVFAQFTEEELEQVVGGEDANVADGGAALVAYNYLQYSHISDPVKEAFKSALFKYCELDNFAMVMLVEGLDSLEEKV